MFLTFLFLACTDGKDTGTAPVEDYDGDGVLDVLDCAPADPAIPAADEIPYDDLDNDCDPTTPDDDVDGDGFLAAADCDDDDAQLYPGATEICDGLDNDCDGEEDGDDAIDATTLYRDGDGDSYGDDDLTYTGCEAQEGYVETAGDCDDHDPDVNPGAAEVCGDGDDNDCDDSSDGCGFEGEISAPDEAEATLYGSETQQYCGMSVANAGDLDGDGDEEVLVGCPAAREFNPDGSERTWQGQVWLAEGPLTGDVDLGERATGFHVDDDNAYLGWHLGAAPDVDGDGYNSVWMGGAGIGEGGAVYVFGAPLNGDYTDAEADAAILGFGGDVSYDERTGLSDAAWVGDQDGDGTEDALIGSGDQAHYRDDGHAWLMSGPIAGEMNVEDATASFVADTETDMAMPGWFQDGTHVATADMNSDGVGDYLFAQPMADLGGVDSGGVYVAFGPLSGAVDLRDGDADGVWAGEASGDWAGYRGVSVADLDGDGGIDLLIAAPGVDGSAPDQGRIYLEYGAASGWPYTRDLGAADARLERDGVESGWTGWSSALIADATGDGSGDILVGGNGPVWLVEGPTEAGTFELDDVATALTGSSTEAIGLDVAGADTDGDGLADILTGSMYNDSPTLTDTGSVFLLLGRAGL